MNLNPNFNYNTTELINNPYPQPIQNNYYQGPPQFGGNMNMNTPSYGFNQMSNQNFPQNNMNFNLSNNNVPTQQKKK